MEIVPLNVWFWYAPRRSLRFISQQELDNVGFIGTENINGSNTNITFRPTVSVILNPGRRPRRGRVGKGRVGTGIGLLWSEASS
jgi:hypothetical protein